MELRTGTEGGAEPDSARPVRRPSARGTQRQIGSRHKAKTAPAGSSLQWVTARVPGALLRRLEAHAKASGTNRSDAIRECLEVGIEAVQHREGVPEGRVDDLVDRLDTAILALDIIGPSALGMLRLLAHWAVQDGSVKLGEDEVVTEVRAIGSEEWDQLVSEGQRPVGRPESAAADGER